MYVLILTYFLVKQEFRKQHFASVLRPLYSIRDDLDFSAFNWLAFRFSVISIPRENSSIGP